MTYGRFLGLCFVATVSACAFDGSESGGGGGGGGSAEAGSGASTTATSSQSSAGTGVSTAADQGQSEGTQADATSATSVPTSGTESPPTGGSDAATTASSTTGGTTQHHVANAAQTACENNPLWCHAPNNVDSPLGGPVFGMECFSAPIAAPFELAEVHYSVAATHVAVEGFVLEIRHRDDSGPTDLIAAFDMDSGDVSPNEHTIALPEPVLIDSDEFCVGFALDANASEGALGMAVDTDSAVENVSFMRMGPGPCNVPDWVDVIDAAPVPTGNWCIDATIQEL